MSLEVVRMTQSRTSSTKQSSNNNNNNKFSSMTIKQ